MSIQTKILLGFFVPIFMLTITGIWASYQMRSLGRSVDTMFRENERSITYAVRMNEAIERIDSGILLKLHGDDDTYTQINSIAIQDFKAALDEEKQNITLPGERELVDSLDAVAVRYLASLGKFEGSSDFEFYRTDISPDFKQLQRLISDLRLINSRAIYSSMQMVVDKAYRAALPGDFIIFSVILFSVLFVWLSTLYIVKPLKDLYSAVVKWRNTGIFPQITSESDDEIKKIISALSAISTQYSRRT